MTDKTGKDELRQSGDCFAQIDDLATQVKVLALNLAISLAQAKDRAGELAYLEPEFTKLISGSVDVIKDVTSILKAFRNEDKMVYSPPSESEKLDRIESSLNEILRRSQSVLKTIAEVKKRKGRVDNYRQGADAGHL
jgi:methyl-accepting chemotaxis protein